MTKLRTNFLVKIVREHEFAASIETLANEPEENLRDGCIGCPLSVQKHYF